MTNYPATKGGPYWKKPRIHHITRWWFQIFFIFTPNLGVSMIQTFTSIFFSDGLVKNHQQAKIHQSSSQIVRLIPQVVQDWTMVRQVRGKSVAAWRLTRTDAAAGGPAVLTAQETCQAPSEWFINDSSQRMKNRIPRIWNACALKFLEPKNGWLDFQIWFQFRGPLTANRRCWGIANCAYIKLLCFRSCFFFHFFLSSWFVSLIFVLSFWDLSSQIFLTKSTMRWSC